MKKGSTWLRIFATAALGLCLAVVAVGCGGDDEAAPTRETPAATETGATDGVAEAKQLVAQEEQVPESVSPPTDAVDASAARGKTFMVIPVLGTIPVAQITNAALREALSLVDADLVEIDGKGQVAVWARAIEQGVSRKVEGIAIEGIAPRAVEAPLRAAENARIPVVASFDSDPGLPSAGDARVGVDARVSYSWSEIGRRMAHYVIADSDGKAHVVIISSSDVDTSKNMVDAAQEEFERLCPDCEVEVRDAPQTQPSQRLATLTRTIVNKDRTVDYFMPVFDAMALTMVPAIHGAGAADRVKIVTSNGTPAVLEFIKRGDVVVADVGANIAWSGWGIADQFFRLLNGQDVVADVNVPTRTFSANNVDELDLDGDQSTWFGTDTWKDDFKRAWGIE
jgi:ribose transport system substrate-binding protein